MLRMLLGAGEMATATFDFSKLRQVAQAEMILLQDRKVLLRQLDWRWGLFERVAYRSSDSLKPEAGHRV